MKIVISESLSSRKDKLEPWAEIMGAVVKTVVPKVDLGLFGMSSPDGYVVSKATGKKVIEAFKKANYSPFEQVDFFWVIESLHDSRIGVTVDMRDPNREDSEWNKAIIAFYTED